MDITLNRYDALILRLADMSPLARHILEREQYRLRLETDDVDSESVLQECVLALRDDLAAIGLYLTCPLADLYENLETFTQCLDVLTYILPDPFYPKLKASGSIRMQLENLLSGGLGDGSTVLSYLDWLGGDIDAWDLSCAPGVAWLADRLVNTPLFDTYLKQLLEVETSLQHPISLAPAALMAYTKKIRHQADIMHQILDQLTTIPEIAIDADKLTRRLDLYIRDLLQPGHIAENAWLRMTDPETLSPGLLAVFRQRWKEFAYGNKLYGEYYINKQPVTMTSFALSGIAIRLFAENPDRSREDFRKAITHELHPELILTISLRALMMRIIGVLYSPTDDT